MKEGSKKFSRSGSNNKRSHFAGGVLTPPLTKGDARPLWKPHKIVPASRGGVYMELFLEKVAKGLGNGVQRAALVKHRIEAALHGQSADRHFDDCPLFHFVADRDA